MRHEPKADKQAKNRRNEIPNKRPFDAKATGCQPDNQSCLGYRVNNNNQGCFSIFSDPIVNGHQDLQNPVEQQINGGNLQIDGYLII